jgi:hypothetical protein
MTPSSIGGGDSASGVGLRVGGACMAGGTAISVNGSVMSFSLEPSALDARMRVLIV